VDSSGDDRRGERRLQREQDPPGRYLFVSERGAPMSAVGFRSVHPHMLRHACGYALANAGHDTRRPQAYLGHKNIQHTVRYTELAPDRFRDFWRD
jgi:site-specific recombinase XerD